MTKEYADYLDKCRSVDIAELLNMSLREETAIRRRYATEILAVRISTSSERRKTPLGSERPTAE